MTLLDYLSVAETAKKLCIAESTLRNKISSNQDVPKSEKIMSRRLFHKREVDAWIAAKIAEGVSR